MRRGRSQVALHSWDLDTYQSIDVGALPHYRSIHRRFVLGLAVMTSTLYWFHAFWRPTPAEYIAVLLDGAAPAPPHLSKSTKNESYLGIDPPHVYAYLGRTITAFDRSVLVLTPSEDVAGFMSPFDTGGLVRRIQPVGHWSDKETRQYLSQYSFPTSSFQDCVDAYPTVGAPQVQAYISGARPQVDGPHVCWPDGELQASIWGHGKNSWQAWTWELRVPEFLPSGSKLAHWTCPPDFFAELLEHAIDADPAGFADLAGRYVEGGSSLLLSKYANGELV
jgi:hypothetical protein